jgi:hypothetical protein
MEVAWKWKAFYEIENYLLISNTLSIHEVVNTWTFEEEVHQRRCTRGGAPEEVHQRRCTRGGAPEEVHPRRCTTLQLTTPQDTGYCSLQGKTVL